MSRDNHFEDQVVSAATPEHIMQVGLGFWASKMRVEPLVGPDSMVIGFK
jgi:hypothetical protein